MATKSKIENPALTAAETNGMRTLAGQASEALRTSADGVMAAARFILSAFRMWESGGKRKGSGFYAAWASTFTGSDGEFLTESRVSQLKSAGLVAVALPDVKTEGEARRIAQSIRKAGLDVAKDPKAVTKAVAKAGGITKFVKAHAPAPRAAASEGKAAGAAATMDASDPFATVHDFVTAALGRMDVDQRRAMAETLRSLAKTCEETLPAETPKTGGKAKSKLPAKA
jgi:hypothetical protein